MQSHNAKMIFTKEIKEGRQDKEDRKEVPVTCLLELLSDMGWRPSRLITGGRASGSGVAWISTLNCFTLSSSGFFFTFPNSHFVPGKRSILLN
jgi:hypothetical protein